MIPAFVLARIHLQKELQIQIAEALAKLRIVSVDGVRQDRSRRNPIPQKVLLDDILEQKITPNSPMHA